MVMQYSTGLLRLIEKHLQDKVEVITDESPSIFEIAYETKDPDELEKLRDVGKRTGAAMQATRDWLSTHRAVDGQIVNGDGKPLTVGAVKRYLRFQLLERDLEEEATIFAQGRDAGIPHNRGEADDILRAGETIVFDLFPRCINTGYYHDMTRTWSLGFAREEVLRDYNTVRDVFFRSLEEITIGQPTHTAATKVCEWFEAAGHPTRRTTPNTTEGYVHALGHGIGLEVHEPPTVSHNTKDEMIFKAGNVLTIEPGLYYPSKGYGIRIEDAVYLDENGQLQNLTDCPYDLVIPLQE
jgi:Xaa-Pro aminopeptidase